MPRYRNIHAIRAIRFRPTKSLYRLLHRAQEAIGKSSRTNRNTTLLARTYNARLHTLRWYYFCAHDQKTTPRTCIFSTACGASSNNRS